MILQLLFLKKIITGFVFLYVNKDEAINFLRDTDLIEKVENYKIYPFSTHI